MIRLIEKRQEILGKRSMILMRHGQSHFNVHYGETRRDPGLRDPGLTDLGRDQAARAAAHDALDGVARIVASPYTRALETAEIVAEILDLSFSVEPTIGERACFTCDIGTPRSDLQKRWPHLSLGHIQEEWWPALEESEDALDTRSRRFRDNMTRSEGWRGVLAVTHWGFIRALTGHGVQNADLVLFDPTAPHPGGGAVVPLSDTC